MQVISRNGIIPLLFDGRENIHSGSMNFSSSVFVALAFWVGITPSFAFNPRVSRSQLRSSLGVLQETPSPFLKSPSLRSSSSRWTCLFSSKDPSNEGSKSKRPFDEKLRSKLVSEAIAPWRTVRLFLYGTLGAGALVGGLITLAGTVAAMQGARPDLDMNEQVSEYNLRDNVVFRPACVV